MPLSGVVPEGKSVYGIFSRNGTMQCCKEDAPTKKRQDLYCLVERPRQWVSEFNRAHSKWFTSSVDSLPIEDPFSGHQTVKHLTPIVDCVPFCGRSENIRAGCFVSGDVAGNVNLWRINSGPRNPLSFIAKLISKQSTLTALCYAQREHSVVFDDFLVSGDKEGNLWIWNFSPPNKNSPPPTIDQFAQIPPHKIASAHKAPITHLSSKHKGVLISASEDGVVKIWAPKTYNCLAERSFAPLMMTSLIAIEDHAILGTEDGTLISWEWRRDRVKAQQKFHPHPITALFFKKSKPLLAIGYANGDAQFLPFATLPDPATVTDKFNILENTQTQRPIVTPQPIRALPNTQLQPPQVRPRRSLKEIVFLTLATCVLTAIVWRAWKVYQRIQHAHIHTPAIQPRVRT
jgi:hypothetical protein